MLVKMHSTTPPRTAHFYLPRMYTLFSCTTQKCSSVRNISPEMLVQAYHHHSATAPKDDTDTVEQEQKEGAETLAIQAWCTSVVVQQHPRQRTGPSIKILSLGLEEA